MPSLFLSSWSSSSSSRRSSYIAEAEADDAACVLGSEGTEGRKLPWVQRISAAIGVAKGIQFLHGGIMPGLFANNLKITNILLDQNLVAKIGSYNIPILAETAKSEVKP